jgi:hypothetical protein
VRRRLGSLGFAAVAFTSSLLGQASKPHPCDAQSGRTKLICRAGYDALYAAVPVAGLAVSAGNPSLGSAAGGTGFGDIGITIRGNLVQTVIPVTSYDGSTDTVRAARRLPVAVPSLAMRFGILRRALPVGQASIDLLGAVLGIPKSATDYVRFSDDVRSIGGVVLGFGYGLRIGFEPKGPLPVASLTVTRHDLPKATVGDVASGSTFAYTVAVSALNARLLVGRRFGAFELTGGGGADLMKGSYSLVFVDPTTQTPQPRADSSVSTMRIVTVTNAAFHFGRAARLVFEGGFQVGKDDKLPTIFEASNTKSGRFFGGVGLGFKL